jgi:hypothetical protein
MRVFHHTGNVRIAFSCSAGSPLEHDPEKSGHRFSEEIMLKQED